MKILIILGNISITDEYNGEYIFYVCNSNKVKSRMSNLAN